MRKGWVSAGALMLAASMLLSACGGSSTAGSDKPSESPKPSAAQSAQPTKSEPVKFSAFISGGNLPTPDKDPILQQLNKDLNMDMELNSPASDYDQQLNVKLAGGTPPDLFSVSKSQMEKYAQQGLLLELDAYLDQMPNIKQTFTETDLNKGKIDGKLYAIARRPGIPMGTFWVRKDWLDKVGLQAPQTLDDLKEVLVAFTNDDPDGNGKKDTFGLTGISFNAFEGIFAAFGVGSPGSWMIEDNQVIYATADERMQAALGYIQELVKLGVVDPEIMANKNLDDQDKAFKGIAGVLYRNWGEIQKENYVEIWKNINPAADWLQLDGITGPGGQYAGVWDEGATIGRVAISKTVEKHPEKLNKILEYLNYITEPGEGQMIVNYGIEGTHYKADNGKITLLPEISETNYAWQIQLTGRNELDYLSIKFPDQKPYIDFANQLPRIKKYNEFVPLPEGVIYDDKQRYETEELTKFIYGKRPLSEFANFVDTLEKTYQQPLYANEAEKALKDLGYLK